MLVKYDENGYIAEWANCPDDGKHIIGMDGAEKIADIAVPATLGYDLWDFMASCRRVSAGDVKFSEDRYSKIRGEKANNVLRARREKECFAYVDRSAMWYDTLTEAQTAELKAWYRKWLDVTETKTVPERPSWLKEDM